MYIVQIENIMRNVVYILVVHSCLSTYVPLLVSVFQESSRIVEAKRRLCAERALEITTLGHRSLLHRSWFLGSHVQGRGRHRRLLRDQVSGERGGCDERTSRSDARQRGSDLYLHRHFELWQELLTPWCSFQTSSNRNERVVKEAI